MRYDRIGIATEAYADALDDGLFGLSFDITSNPSLTVVVDRATLECLRDQIAAALMPQPPAAAHS